MKKCKIWDWLNHHKTIVFLFGIGVLQMLFLLLFTGYFYETYLLNDYAGEALNHDTVYFVVSNAEVMDFSELPEQEIICDATLLRHIPGTNYDYEILYTQGKKDIFAGKYFEAFDFGSEVPAAVLGCTAAELRWQDGTVMVEGYTYPVVEIMPETLFATRNNAVFYTNASLMYVAADSIFAIASESKEAAEKSFQRLTEWLVQKEITVTQINMPVLDTSSFLNYHTGLLVGFLGYLILLCAVNILLMFYWYYQQENWLRVMKLFGESRLKLRLLGRFLRIQALAFGSGLVGYLAVTQAMHRHGVAVWGGIILIVLIQLLGSVIFFVVKGREN